MVNAIPKFQVGFSTSIEASLTLFSSTQSKRRVTHCDPRKGSTGLCRQTTLDVCPFIQDTWSWSSWLWLHGCESHRTLVGFASRLLFHIPTHPNRKSLSCSSFYFICTLPFSSSPGIQATPYISLSAAGTVHTNWYLNILDVRLYSVKLPDIKLDGFKFLWSDP